MKQNKNNQAFTLVELLVVISIIGLLSTVVVISFGGVREKASSMKDEIARGEAGLYCAMNPGVSYPNGDQAQPVYCDNNSVMWSPTLLTVGGEAAKYAWATQLNGAERNLPAYAKGNCNNLTDKDIVDYPACQACRNLDYAGFSEGWRLPTQSNGNLDGNYNCNYACGGYTGDGGAYCAPGRELWDFGAENCPVWGTLPCGASQGKCQPISWDAKAQASGYWSSTQLSATSAWNVHFNLAYAGNGTKSVGRYVRCALGKYSK